MDSIPQEMQLVVEKLRSTPSKSDALRMAYDVLSKRYKGQRIKTYTRLHELFIRDIATLWAKTEFLHCTHINNLLIELLVRSGHFERQDIEKHWTLVWYISPHQYLRVRLNESTKVDVDIWAKNYGVPFGSHAHGFNTALIAIE